MKPEKFTQDEGAFLLKALSVYHAVTQVQDQFDECVEMIEAGGAATDLADKIVAFTDIPDEEA